MIAFIDVTFWLKSGFAKFWGFFFFFDVSKKEIWHREMRLHNTSQRKSLWPKSLRWRNHVFKRIRCRKEAWKIKGEKTRQRLKSNGRGIKYSESKAKAGGPLQTNSEESATVCKWSLERHVRAWILQCPQALVVNNKSIEVKSWFLCSGSHRLAQVCLKCLGPVCLGQSRLF